MQKSDVLPPNHGLVGQTGNASRSEACEYVVYLVKHIADYVGNPLPVRIIEAEKLLMEGFDGTEQIFVLPPQYTKLVLFSE